MKTIRWPTAALALSTVASIAIAAGGTRTYRLPWPVDGQILEYRSCGCADACWKAEVKNARTKAVVATLRCDCEHLYFSSKAHSKEQLQPQACMAIDDKPQFIRQTLEESLTKDLK